MAQNFQKIETTNFKNGAVLARAIIFAWDQHHSGRGRPCNASSAAADIRSNLQPLEEHYDPNLPGMSERPKKKM